jgi:hypothetical protein
VLIYINFLSLRQAVTPAPLLGRMTSTVRWLILLPAGPGALVGGWLGEHVSLRASLLFAGASALLAAAVVWRWTMLRGVRELPKPESEEDALGAEAAVSALPIGATSEAQTLSRPSTLGREPIDRVGDQPIEPHAEQGARA